MAWRGEHIQVDQAATGKLVWSWWKCVRCDREMFDGRDIDNGLHWRCSRGVSEREAERLRSSARERDRARYARDHGIGSREAWRGRARQGQRATGGWFAADG